MVRALIVSFFRELKNISYNYSRRITVGHPSEPRSASDGRLSPLHVSGGGSKSQG